MPHFAGATLNPICMGSICVTELPLAHHAVSVADCLVWNVRLAGRSSSSSVSVPTNFVYLLSPGLPACNISALSMHCGSGSASERGALSSKRGSA
jgi:hypothetical protein